MEMAEKIRIINILGKEIDQGCFVLVFHDPKSADLLEQTATELGMPTIRHGYGTEFRFYVNDEKPDTYSKLSVGERYYAVEVLAGSLRRRDEVITKYNQVSEEILKARKV
ncbi:MAG: hypothetical protein WC596_02345 [Candidatus Shapirobacteria bacterium]